MKCPACNRKLSGVSFGGVHLDICQGGCGGIWFGANELTKVNAEQRKSGKSFEIARDESVRVDMESARSCPQCHRVKLVRRLFSLGTGVEMDSCEKCGGIWLDHGELELIQEETNPKPRPVRHVVEPQPRGITINFGVIQKVQALRISILPAK